MSKVPEWTPLGYVEDSMVEQGYRRQIESVMGNTQLILALELQREGGPCPICRKEYRRIEIDNLFGKFNFYEPDCECFKVCARCGRYMVSERLLGIDHCTGCGFGKRSQPIEKMQKKRAFRDGKSAAAGEEG